MSHTAALMATLLSVALCAPACGRTELDWTTGTTNVTTGAAPSAGAAGGGGVAPVSPGVGWRAGRPEAVIPCGNGVCLAGSQICCLHRSRGESTESCISSGATCDSGASIACVASSTCGAGQVCCGSLRDPVVACVAAASCASETGVTVCVVNANCPASAAHCCQANGIGVCSSQACRTHDGQGGPDGDGEGGPED